MSEAPEGLFPEVMTSQEAWYVRMCEIRDDDGSTPEQRERAAKLAREILELFPELDERRSLIN